MGKLCLVCRSIHRDEYDKRLNDGWEIKEVWRYARREHNEKFSYQSMLNHFHKDVEDIIDAHKKADKIRKDIIEKQIEEEILVSQELRNDLAELSNQLKLLKNKELTDPQARKEIRDIIYASARVIELSLKFADKLEFKPRLSEEEIYDKVIKCMNKAEIPYDLIMKFMDEWDSYES